jgi:long-subunit fatty acid transport protein
MKTIAVAISLLASSTAYAGGVALPARGVHATSAGGAYVAGAEGANAFWYNPARLDETMIALEAGVVSLSAAFTPSEGEQLGTRVENRGRPLPSPTLGFVFKVTDMLSVGVAAYAPYAGFQRFDETGPQRYALVESDRTTLLHLAAGAAFRFNRMRVGATVQNVMGHLKQRIVLSGYTGLFGHAEDPELDILEEIELKDDVNITGNIGASFELGDFTLGAAVQLPYKLSGEAAYRVRLPSSAFFDGMSVEGDKVHLEVPFPTMIRGGVRWKAHARLALEVAVNFEQWSVQDELIIDPQGRIKLHDVPGIGDYELPKIVVDRRMKDTISLHLGGDFEVLDGLHLRAGGYFEPSAFGDETFSVAQLDDDKVGIGLGASWTAGSFRFDVAASRVFQGTRVINSSELKQLNPTNPDQAVVIGNGTYESNYWVAGAGVEYRFGAR